MEKKDAEVTLRCDRFGQDAAIHIGMAPGFPDKGCTEMIEVLLGITALLQDGLPWNRGEALHYKAERLSSGMSIDRLYAHPTRWRFPDGFHSSSGTDFTTD
jgi:hypothetical protein